VLVDEGKRTIYDTFGFTGNPNYMGGPGEGGTRNNNFLSSWNFQLYVSIGQLFHQLFNSSGFAGFGNNNSSEEDFADCMYIIS